MLVATTVWIVALSITRPYLLAHVIKESIAAQPSESSCKPNGVRFMTKYVTEVFADDVELGEAVIMAVSEKRCFADCTLAGLGVKNID
ncbi:hypothetical protein LBM2029_23080 (plasmid) [Ralstonia solanacearum]|nr:hypothetical protein LBM2029_23080 [Ralstonia solanacearum]